VNKIVFTPSSQDTELLIEPPSSAKKSVPDWYKKSPAFDQKNYRQSVLKQCMPFFDATISGYIQRTWKEIYIGSKDGNLFFDSAEGLEILSHRENASLPVSDGFYPVEFIWRRHWSVELPKGYSMLVTHPHNRLDLPFTTLSGVVDSDLFHHTPVGSIPFYVQKGFTGIIPVGTPMYQIIPFKRENWESETEPFNEAEVLKRNNIMRRRFYSAYRDMFWQKKTYN
jgi:hypothetical protein